MRPALPLSAIVLLVATSIASANPARLVEPALRLPQESSGEARVALTLDACGGRTDTRILSALVENRIPATIFVTGIWLRRNPDAVAILKAHPDLFEIENHGAHHIPAIDRPVSVYGIAAAGSTDGVAREVMGGADAMAKAGLSQPHWFRGATAKYTSTSIAQIQALGFRIAGYSLNADGGSLLGTTTTEHRVEAARDGDVLIAHINQPTHPAGAGLVKGLLALKARGISFVRLADVAGNV
ncbi:MAG: polysaccharide deacetylase [Rhizobiales bacterium 68-8]|nr:MAG: polysaccharide deacetylase [Rhizobiales bacterium 68-8]